MKITKELLCEYFDYNPVTGQLFWKKATYRRGTCGQEYGSLKNNGYRAGSFFGKKCYTHQIIWSMHHGPYPKGMVIDHIDRVRSNNLISNLRVTTNALNCANSNKHKPNKHGLRGVMMTHYKNTTTPWRARISHNGKGVYLGCFDTKEKAAIAFNNAALSLRGEFAILNEL
jgi:hypothetical protein